MAQIQLTLDELRVLDGCLGMTVPYFEDPEDVTPGESVQQKVTAAIHREKQKRQRN